MIRQVQRGHEIKISIRQPRRAAEESGGADLHGVCRVRKSSPELGEEKRDSGTRLRTLVKAHGNDGIVSLPRGLVRGVVDVAFDGLQQAAVLEQQPDVHVVDHAVLATEVEAGFHDIGHRFDQSLAGDLVRLEAFV